MGCDIHAYVEYKSKNSDYWMPFAGRINPGRNYGTFARIAGVRTENPTNAIVDQRGFPKDAGFEATVDNWLVIVDDEKTDAEGCCTREQAERWIASGSSRYNENKTQVTHPDWHSHTWLTMKEWRKATVGGGERYKAITAAMKSLEKSGFETRVICWFDN